ncbi:phosphopantetheine-binding protein [Streptomyces sp. NPDC020362]|uniref:acyl carrier protein n=1 Tax=unclassified Streptomyces TaxID=2593676 RepID=UPI000A422E10
MTVEEETSPLTAESLEKELLDFLAERIKSTVEVDQDLFASGLVSSMFAMQLVVHLEEAYDIAIVGGDLKLDNFRTVQTMTGLVLRLRNAESADNA